MGDDADDGLGPPSEDDAGEDLAPPDDDADTTGWSAFWPSGPPGGAEGTPPNAGLAGDVATPSAWPASTAPIEEVPPPPPPGRRRAVAIVAVAVALALAGGVGAVIALSRGSSKAPPAAAPTAAPSPSLLPPAGLTASAEPFSVTLSWSQPPGGAAIDTYLIYRNDSPVDEVAVGTTTYSDKGVTPGKKYTYELKAKGGTLETEFVSVSVTTPKPPVEDARLAGDFNVNFTITSSTGFQTVDPHFTAGWHFKPKCKTGACAVTWSDLSEDSLKAALKRKGATYTGSDSGLFFATCGSHQATSDLTIDFKVTKAKGIDGQWLATRIEGTVTHFASAQLGCVSSSATMKVAGTLLS
ncbi:MAG TPA: fibronectin type III domain-containing protein [Actinomycetota bacterium]